MTSSTRKLIVQLRALLQLTQTEAQIAEIRVAQARTDAVRRELRQNAENARQRSRAIAEQLRDLGGVPDLVAPLFGRLTGLAKSGLEQAQPLPEALLGDLALEYQLLSRARYLKALAETAEIRSVSRLADRLIVAHTATVEWLTTVLAEEALGGPAAIRPTPLQLVSGGLTRLANLPVRWTAEAANRALDTMSQTAEQARDTVVATSQRAAQLRDAATDVLTASRDAGLLEAEKVARRDGDKQLAASVHETRRDLGTLTAAELPIKDYESLSNTQAVEAIRQLTKAEDIRAVVGFEETHKNRRGIVSAAQTHLADVAKDLIKAN